ncbi:uncharacterized protein ACLA_063670 [Aspergillus clavatus NRRL 1]|uniref:Uncharacterized protein n=1 Tax=Aspergillus clavatus (strain ATCC 1007 / CBS 513.65 / DSM 816 / NCTC 3887 / NRRL 1 / QM 1276 / 107) TaxID=344612 RepID=A1CCZ1_ASPCL|nr:uncharacterized protein ACLA_063670 [Aspergillus clavatus NRRL 1]EAW12398.1 conserved hypothetical protein [Aspergillus clavatus NRRL 1]
MAEPSVYPPNFTSFLDQDQSSLFSVLPPEIRHEIFAYALASFEDTDRPYSRETYWTRPGYTAPHRTCTELLRTCKRIYREAWFLPFASAEHSFYLTSHDRQPDVRFSFQDHLNLIHSIHGETSIGRIRIFAQLWALEDGVRMEYLLNMSHFAPRSITLTIRYTDFWWWERDQPLSIQAPWVNRIRLPASVTRFAMDFESIERRKGEIDYIANQAAETWFFRRRDGQFLTADKADMTVSKWTGSSILGKQRWLRDEVRPGQLDYHVVTVVWRVSPGLKEEPLPTPCPTVQVPPDFQRPTPPSRHASSVLVDHLQAAQIAPDLSAEETFAALQAYHRRLMEERLAIRRRSTRRPRSVSRQQLDE